MSVSRICLILAEIAIISSLAASLALASPLADDGRSAGGQASMVTTVTAADTNGQGWFGG